MRMSGKRAHAVRLCVPMVEGTRGHGQCRPRGFLPPVRRHLTIQTPCPTFLLHIVAINLKERCTQSCKRH